MIKLRELLKFLVILLFLVNSLDSLAQIPDEDKLSQLEEKLEEKDIPEDVIRQRLLEKGIDLDNLDPQELPRLERTIQQIIEEYEVEQADSAELNLTDSEGEVAAQPDPVSIETSVEKSVQDLVNQKVREASSIDAKEIEKRMKFGATLEEALSDHFSEKLINEFSLSTTVWGHELFFNKSLEVFRTVSSSTTPESYVLDAGDKLAINIFGVSQIDLIYSIGDDGFIRPNRGPKIYLRGMTIGKAKKLLEKRFGESYMFSKGQFSVELNTARTITVNVLGEINRSGSYSLSALNNALNAIVAAGGPKPSGTIRNIQIISNGKVKILDVYDLMYNPKSFTPIGLKDNDIIFIPLQGKIIESLGEGFKHQAKFELQENEHFNSFIKYSEGLTYNANSGKINHEYYNGVDRKIKTTSLEEAKNNNLKLGDGDKLYVNVLEKNAKNFVEVTGGLLVNGKFQWRNGMRVSDLIGLAQLEEETYMNFAYLKKKNIDGSFQIKILNPKIILDNIGSEEDLLLHEQDEIKFFSQSEFKSKYRIAVGGYVRQPGGYDYSVDKNITIYDAINMSLGLRSVATDFGYIITPSSKDLNKIEYEIFDLKTIIENPNSKANKVLNPNDSIYVPSRMEFSEKYAVGITGAVRNEGVFTYDKSLTLKNLLIMSGGFTVDAAYNRIDIFRIDISQENKTRTLALTVDVDQNFNPLDTSKTIYLKPFDQIAVRSAPEFEMMKFVSIEGEVKYPGRYAILRDNEKLSDLIIRAGGLTDEAFPEGGSVYRPLDDIGFIVTSIDKILSNYNSKYNLILRDGDGIKIPKKVDIVFVNYEGTNAEDLYKKEDLDTSSRLIAANYQPRNAKWYINNYAAGFGKGAKRGRTTVRESNGRIRKTKNFILFRVYPKATKGSIVKVELKPSYVRREAKRAKELKNENGPKKNLLEESSKFVTILTGLLGVTSQTISTIVLVNSLK